MKHFHMCFSKPTSFEKIEPEIGPRLGYDFLITTLFFKVRMNLNDIHFHTNDKRAVNKKGNNCGEGIRLERDK